MRTENIRLQGDIDRLTRQVNKLVTEKQSASAQSIVSNPTPPVTPESPKQEPKDKPTEEPNKGGGWWLFGKRN